MDMKNLGRNPISDEQPAGVDVSYSDDYQELVAEIKKLSSPTANSVIDWSNVTRLCTKILENESKNILVACFLSISLVRNEGMKGCSTAIHILRDMVEVFWDELYPPKKRKKGRINALTWWNDNLKKLLEPIEPEFWETEERQSLLDDLTFIDDIISSKLPDGPILRPLISLLSSRILEHEKEKNEPVDNDGGVSAVAVSENAQNMEIAKKISQNKIAGKPPTNGSVFEQAIQAPSGNSTEEVDAATFLATGRDFLLQAAKKFLAQDQKCSTSYQLNRLVAWGQIDTAPPAANGETMLPPPGEQLVSILESQYQSRNWPELLMSAEGNIRQYLFWIDLSFWVATALKELGAVQASKSVALETRNYVQKIKGVETMSFQGGLAFARSETRAWLHESAGSKNPVQLSQDQSSAESEFAGCLTEALKLVGADGPQEAVLFFQSNLKDTGSGKGSFFMDLGLCNIMQKAGNADLALPFAERALHAVDKIGLEEWEPELAVTALTTVHNAYKLQIGEQWPEKLRMIASRITLLAPEKAIHLF